MAKHMFLLNLSQGDQIRIPNELTQSSCSFSYRFYDPVLFIAH